MDKEIDDFVGLLIKLAIAWVVFIMLAIMTALGVGIWALLRFA